jgi:glyoxylase-like metal-dependent hydrolase (beta-lactamase superfamily II)
MRVYSIQRPVMLRGARFTFSFMSSVTVAETGESLLVFDSGLNADEGLERGFYELGLDPDRVSHVFLTHVHIDHFGGNPRFSKAKKVMSRLEYEYQKKWNEGFCAASDKTAHLSACFPNLTARESEKVADMLAAGQARYFKDEIIGASESRIYIEDDPLLPACVRVIRTPGHTPHHLAFVVLNGQRAAFVTGDLFPGRKSFFGEGNGFIEVYSDPAAAESSLARVRGLAGGFGDSVICPAHDRPFDFRTGAYVRKNPW